MNTYRYLIGLTGLVCLGLACGALGGATNSSGGNVATGRNEYDTNFPLPDSVSDFTSTGQDSINFQTSLNLQESIDFYREALGGQGLTERTINTAITDTTFSLVFDGDSNGKALVVQGVDLGNGRTNINIRYEDV